MRFIAILLLIFPCCAATAEVLRSPHLSVEYREAGGARITLGGVPIIRASSIQLHAPDWKKGYYSSNSSPRKVKVDAKARTITIRHSADKHVTFKATETYRLIDDNTVEVTLKGQLDTDAPANLEWAIGYVNAFALYGGSYVDQSKPGEHAQPVELIAPAPADDPAVISNTRMIKLSTRVGSMTCVVDEDAPRLTLLDGRLAPERWWAQETPTFWLGALNVKLTPGEPFELRAIIECSPAPAPDSPPAVTNIAATRHVERIYEPPHRPYQVIPTPKRMVIHEGQVPIRSLWGESASITRLARMLERETGVPIRASGPPYQLGLRRFTAVFATDDALKPEAYSISADQRWITIRAADEAGFRNAVHTLIQLVRIGSDGGIYLPACEINDEPSLAFRGVHIFPGKDSLDFHRRLIENVLARYKFNHVILECEYTQWESAPGIWVDFSVPKEQIRQHVQMLRDNGLEPIPLVQSLGHMWWMFRNDQNLHLAEDPQMPRAYDATNPQTYEFIDRIYEEALELFGDTKYFHIGHDEITLFGRYPHREESKKWGVTKLFLSDIAHWERFFRPRSIQPMMWGDMLLAKEEIKDGAAFGDSLEEAKKRRAALSKDIIICDWHYDALKPEDYPSLKIFKDAGFTTIASTWYNPLNIYNFAEAARRNEAWGLLQTTWAGYNIHEGVLDEELRQFAAYILAAEYAWSGKSPPPRELPWRADEVLIRALDSRPQHPAPQPGFTTELSGWMLLEDWLELGSGADLTVLRTTDRVDGYQFNVSERAVVLGGNLLPQQSDTPAGASIKITGNVRQLAFLHATAFPAERGEEIGRYEVRYTDGSTERVPLRYGIDIRAWNDPAIARNALGSLVEKNEAGVTVAARVFVWNNPHPDKPIETVTVATDHPYASPALFGLSGISAGGE